MLGGMSSQNHELGSADKEQETTTVADPSGDLARAEAYGIDLELLKENLRLTPKQRLEQLHHWMSLMHDSQRD